MPQIVTTSSRKSKKASSPVILITAVLVIVAGAFIYFRVGKGEKPVAPVAEIPVAIAKKSVTASPKAVIETTTATHNEPTESNDNEVAEVVNEQKTTVVKEKPKTAEELGLPIVNKKEKAKVRRVFDTNTERIISGFANTKRGFPPPPLLNIPFGENLNEILNSDIVIYEDDDERTVAIKENCAQLKEEMKQYIADGGTPENFLAWYHNELSKDYNSWKDSQQYIVQLMKEGMIQEAEEYMEKANAELTKSGIRNVTIPDNLRKLAEKKLKELEQAQ